MKKRVKKVRIRLVPNRDVPNRGVNGSSYAEYVWSLFAGSIAVATGHNLLEVGDDYRHVYAMGSSAMGSSAHDRNAGGTLWKFSGDLKAMKRHYPEAYARRKAAGLLVSASGRKLP